MKWKKNPSILKCLKDALFAPGSRSYCQQSHREKTPGEDWRRDVIDQDFAGAVMNRLGDQNAKYVDGGGNFIKGNHPLMSLLVPGLSGVGAEDRRGAGYNQGMNEAAAVIESLIEQAE